MKIAVVGATGLVGNVMLQVLLERKFPFTEILPVASEKSIGKKIDFNGSQLEIIGMKQAISLKPDIAIFSAGGSTSLQWAPEFAKVGTTVIDNLITVVGNATTTNVFGFEDTNGCVVSTFTGNGAFVPGNKGTFTQAGQLKIKIGSNTFYIPYGTVA